MTRPTQVRREPGAFDSIYTLAVQLHPTPIRARLLDELVRQSRWQEYVRQHRETVDGIEAGRVAWLKQHGGGTL